MAGNSTTGVRQTASDFSAIPVGKNRFTIVLVVGDAKRHRTGPIPSGPIGHSNSLQSGEFLRLRTSAFLFMMSLGPLFGQGMTLVGSGYPNPASIRVSPGSNYQGFRV